MFLLLLAALVAFGLTSVRERAKAVDPARHLSDLTCYTEAGGAIFDGRDPYAVTNPRGWRYVYPPILAMLVAPLRVLDAEWQAVVWFLVSVAFVFGCYFETARLMAFLLRREATALAEVPIWLRLSPILSVALYGITCLERGQVSILLLYLLLLGLRLVLTGERRLTPISGGIAFAAAIAIKVTPAVPAVVLVAALLIARRGRSGLDSARLRAAGAALGLVLGAVIFFVVAPSLIVGWQGNLIHLRTFVHRIVLNPHWARDAGINIAGPGNQGLPYAVRNFGNWLASGGRLFPSMDANAQPDAAAPMASAAGSTIALAALAGLVASFGAAVWRLARARGPLDVALAFALACTATVVLSPLSWSHYFVLTVPAFLLVPWWLLRRGFPRLAFAAGWIPFAIELQHYVFRGTLRLVGTLGVAMAAWLAVVCVAIAVTPRGRIPRCPAVPAAR